MKKITDILTDFFSIMRNEILDYYQKSYSYLKDLVAYKKIELKKQIESQSEKQIKSTLAKMLKAIKTGLNTLGVSMDMLNENQNSFLETLSKERSAVQDYNSYFESYMKNYVNEVLFKILLDYLFNIDPKKLETVNLFDLLPNHFISKMDEFKKARINSEDMIKDFRQFDYKSNINFTDLTLIESKNGSELDILIQLKEAKKNFIETLKTPKKEVLKSSLERIKTELVPEKNTLLTKTGIRNSSISNGNHEIRTYPQREEGLTTFIDSGTFLDNIGCFPPIHSELIKKFKIDRVNLINLKVVNREFFDLENLFYYISIVKMLNLEFPFTEFEILAILKEHINSDMFSSSKDKSPDLQNIFFGLAIYSELNLYDKTDQIDIVKIEQFLKSELEPFILEKVLSNFYCVLCLKLLAEKKPIEFNKDSISKLVTDLNILKLNNPKLPLDIYNHLGLIKLLNKDLNLLQLKPQYFDELKKLIASNGSINDIITDTAQTLLIFILLDLKNRESELCSSLVNYLVNKTKFFKMDNLNKDFNWRIDKIGFSIELEMLYWALLASSQFITT
ncbi:MAG: hypothetical protein ACFE9Q_12610 [Candidatus Hodarchaeota archaeon]